MDPREVEIFSASLARCLGNTGFLESFYEAFFDSSEEIREKFKHTNLQRQIRVLADSLYVLAVAPLAEENSPARASLPLLAARHSRQNLGIAPGLYDNWLECLVSTVRRYDPEFTPEIEGAWRTTLGWGIEYMRSRY
jgi:hemoglobin-like flavoprotein